MIHCSLRYVHVAVFAAFSCVVATASDLHQKIDVAGTGREYILHLPPGISKEHPFPLLFVLHGGGGEPKGTARITRMNELADREGFLVAYPAGLRRHWNDGRGEVGAKADDVAFISAIIDDVAVHYDLDRQRIFSTGISNGAFMSARLACELSDRIRAVALVAGTISEALQATCRPKRPVAVVMFSGTDDPLVPYGGGIVRGDRGKVWGVESTAAFWAKANGCAAEPKHRDLAVIDSSDPTRVSLISYPGCPHGGAVQLYTVHGGGHTWPGGRAYLPAFVVGKVTRQIDADDVMWNFFIEQAGGN
jgi:polyhydroxybutyrate depolymerase